MKYNLLNDYSANLRLSSHYYSLEIIDLIDSLDMFLLIILIVSIFVSFASMVVLSVFYYLILKYINKILQVFLEIPINKAKNLFVKCEIFLTNLQQGGDDDDLLDNDNLSNFESEDAEEQGSFTNQSNSAKKIKARRKRYKANYKPLKIFVIELIIVCLCIETFFVMYFLSFKSIFENELKVREELNNTVLLNPMFSFTNNAIRFKFMIKFL